MGDDDLGGADRKERREGGGIDLRRVLDAEGELVAKEISCRARGDAKCIFVMAHASRINERVVEAKERYGLE